MMRKYGLRQVATPKLQKANGVFLKTISHILFFFISASTSLQAVDEARIARMPEKHFALFEKYCLNCHDADTEKGKVNLEGLSFEISRDIPTAQLWDDILAAMNSKEMPPEDKKQVPDDEKAAFLSKLSEQMVVARSILSDSGGEITMRRMNRREYQNTLESLLGLRPDVGTLPDDDGTGGFDTAGASLFFSSDQFEAYRGIARAALQHVLSGNPTHKIVRQEGEVYTQAAIEVGKARFDTYQRAKAYYDQDKKPPAEYGFRDVAHAKKQLERAKPAYDRLKLFVFDRLEAREGCVMTRVKGVPGFRVSIPFAGGRYKIRIRAGAYDDAAARDRFLGLSFYASKTDVRDLAQLKISGSVAEPKSWK